MPTENENAIKSRKKKLVVTMVVISVIVLAGSVITAWQISANVATRREREKEKKLLSVLKERMADNESDLRLGAVRYIGEIKKPIAYPLLIEALHDPDSEVVMLAKETLTKEGIGEQAVALLIKTLSLDEPPDISQAAENCLVKIGEPGIQALINALDTRNKIVRNRLGSCLVKIKPRMVVKERLNEAFKDDSKPAVSLAAKEILYKMEKERPPAATPPLSP
ncbi:HEAT repeat domain-containing protein [Patescibacteria group bacterium]|nr:HEAT repeat domain-containing protein [Patescibacteria group bacterium]MBU4274381.1 HEAT repeat domain-containing protein [Patescibacteria group bacterium]MBU4367511.1 HEAT repeat domain-containing protein [Patescibacteria group bacterium]MBU4461552.1 HEAT repeat domain-containing protein [Patescibacteria group bacterium]MCG2699449.1 HEAT repeat domain-containing protein [Candidatus Parcubacteria bacterium]